jgi:hypothetical protein
MNVEVKQLIHNKYFQKVLNAQKLEDLSQFYSAEFCDEVPLYSRYKQVSFLKDMTLEQGNETLLAMGLDFLENIIANHTGDDPFFAALTVWQDENGELIVPNIYICNTNARRQLKKLNLHKLKAPFSKNISDLVRKATGAARYVVLEDDHTLENDIRVFIGPKKPTCPNLLTLRSLSA